jgi:hypothetical protein
VIFYERADYEFCMNKFRIHFGKINTGQKLDDNTPKSAFIYGRMNVDATHYINMEPGDPMIFHKGDNNTAGLITTANVFQYEVPNRTIDFEYKYTANKLVNTFPADGSVFYGGETLTREQLPRITFYKEVGTTLNAKFTYSITRKANPADEKDKDEIVYVAKSDNTPEADTFILTDGCCRPEIDAYIEHATGSCAGNNGLFKMNDPLPTPGEYVLTVRYYSGSAKHGSKPKEEKITSFTIKEALAQYAGVVPNRDIPIVTSVALSPEQLPSITSLRYTDESPAPIITYTVTDPKGNIVYQALDEETSLPEITLDKDTIGKPSKYYFRNAKGLIASETNPGSFNTSRLERGVYKITVTFDDGILDVHTFEDQFTSTLEYDLQLLDITFPKTRSSATDQTYVVIPFGAKFPIEYTMANMGIYPCYAYEFVAEIYKQGGTEPLQRIVHNFNNSLTPIPKTSVRQMVTDAEVDVDKFATTAGNYVLKCTITTKNPNVDNDNNNHVWPL